MTQEQRTQSNWSTQSNLKKIHEARVKRGDTRAWDWLFGLVIVVGILKGS